MPPRCCRRCCWPLSEAPPLLLMQLLSWHQPGGARCRAGPMLGTGLRLAAAAGAPRRRRRSAPVPRRRRPAPTPCSSSWPRVAWQTCWCLMNGGRHRHDGKGEGQGFGRACCPEPQAHVVQGGRDGHSTARFAHAASLGSAKQAPGHDCSPGDAPLSCGVARSRDATPGSAGKSSTFSPAPPTPPPAAPAQRPPTAMPPLPAAPPTEGKSASLSTWSSCACSACCACCCEARTALSTCALSTLACSASCRPPRLPPRPRS